MPRLSADEIPVHASEITVGMCADPKCGRLHIIMFDENQKPICAGRIEDEVEFIKHLQHWAYIAATRRV